jgi:Fe-S-cluster containining protein
MSEPLCTACGLCCDGNLFAFVAVGSAEAAALKEAGLAVLDEKGRLKLPQRCAALGEDCRCRVYAKRPFGCRKFDCLLARAVNEKDLPVGEALAIVAEAKARLARLEGLLPRVKPGEASGPVRRAAALSQSGAKVSDAARGAWDEAQEFLRRHFVPD